MLSEKSASGTEKKFEIHRRKQKEGWEANVLSSTEKKCGA